MRREYWVLLSLTAFFLLLIVFDPSSNLPLLSVLVRRGGSTSLPSDLAIQNADLRAELAVLKNIQSQLPSVSSRDAVQAVVYAADDPFGYKEELVVMAGRRHGVMHDQPVVLSARGEVGAAEGMVFVGKVEHVFDDYAVVKTVFARGVQLPVRIGPLGVDALLEGGREPRVTLIPSTVRVSEREIVYTASQDISYGMALGEMRDIRASSDQLFYEALLDVPYDISGVRVVTILTSPDAAR